MDFNWDILTNKHVLFYTFAFQPQSSLFWKLQHVFFQDWPLWDSIHLPINSGHLPCVGWREIPPEHNAATTMFDSWAGVFRLIRSVSAMPHIVFCLLTKKLHFGLVWPRALVLHLSDRSWNCKQSSIKTIFVQCSKTFSCGQIALPELRVSSVWPESSWASWLHLVQLSYTLYISGRWTQCSERFSNIGKSIHNKTCFKLLYNFIPDLSSGFLGLHVSVWFPIFS